MELSFPHPVAVDHYENFPVASVLLPARLRRPVGLIYRFARESDDFADEGDLPDAERLALLATLRSQLGSLDKVKRVVKTLGMVNSAADFYDHPKVINGCSELFAEIWGPENGIGARSAIGMGPLPGNIPVEIEVIFELH